MRIDVSKAPGQGGVKIKTGTGAATDSLKEGDVVKAGVVSSDKSGNVTLKMENGQSFSAKLGVDLKLSPGDTILLEVTGKEKDQLSLSFKGVDTADDDLSLRQTDLVKDFTDKSLAPFASKLAELNMPVTETSASMMRELIAANPGLSLDEAAFLASNKLTGDESLMKAALDTLAGGDKTDAMIARLLSLAGDQRSENAPVSTANNLWVPNSPKIPVNSTPLTELITTLVKSFSDTQAIISQPNTNMQINEENGQLFLQKEQITTQNAQGEGSPASQTPGQITQSGGPVVPQNPGETIIPQNTAENPGQITPQQTGTSPGNIVPGEQSTPATQTTVPSETPPVASEQISSSPPPSTTAQTMQSMSNTVANLLSNIPQFSGTPPSALQRFSEMLLRVAGENTEAASDKDSLTAQLDKLFTKIGRDDSDAGTRLRDARQELYTRLALVEEAISSASQPARAEMLVQTQKLMDHVRLLNSIEQFVYMQLPVQLSEERKAADLYVFKRKGGKRADPENVNILLAIDLENMGHWESLVNIKNKDVSIQMEVRGEAEKDHFNSSTVLLHNMLDEAGFKLVSTNIKLAEEETTPLTALSTFDRYTGGKQGIIDFRI